RAIGAEQPDRLAAPHRDRDVAHHDALAEALGQTMGHQPAGLVDTGLARRLAHCEVKTPVTRPPSALLVKVETLVSRFTTSSPAPIVPPAFLTRTLPVRRSIWSPGVKTALSPVASWSVVSRR